MKKIFLTMLLGLMTNLLISQNSSWQIYAGSGYVFPSSLLFQQGTLRSTGAAEVNISAQYNYRMSQGIGFDYTFVPTSVEFTPNQYYANDYKYDKKNMNIHFITVKWVQYIVNSSVANPFFDFGMGMNIYDIQDPNISSSSHFLMTFGGGCDFQFSSVVGLRLRGGVKLPTYGASPGLYCGIGTYNGVGCGLSLGGSALVAHWDLGGGLTFNF